MNPNLMIQQILKAPNKENILENLVKQNPQLQEFWDVFKKGDYNSFEEYVKNKFKENGRDFDKEFSQFMNNFK